MEVHLINDVPDGLTRQATVEGWVESLALSHHASLYAKQVVREVKGLADTWWRGPDSLVALYTGEAAAMSFPRGRTALIYSGLDEWGLRGGVDGV
ncbi:hypothetical protein ACGGAI_29070 [Streptomyces antibioticus]|uniref:hypothetical protein n=1 Tax=Streptomyces antibioticus TaxID=1890 RepID=UPI003718EAD5